MKVEQPGGGGVGDVGHRLAGQHQPDVILRRQYAAGVAELYRFDIAQPECCGSQAIGRGRVPGDREEAVATDVFSHLHRLPEGAPVAAENGRPYDDPPRVHKNGARVAGQANPGNLAAGGPGHRGQRALGRAPPAAFAFIRLTASL